MFERDTKLIEGLNGRNPYGEYLVTYMSDNEQVRIDFFKTIREGDIIPNSPRTFTGIPCVIRKLETVVRAYIEFQPGFSLSNHTDKWFEPMNTYAKHNHMGCVFEHLYVDTQQRDLELKFQNK